MWDRQRIIEEVRDSADEFGSSNPQELNKLTLGCKKASEREVFFGLFSFFYDPSLQDNKFQRQQLAGKILLEVGPTSPLELDGSVYAAANLWNYSIEELPWYWCEKFGKDIVINFLNELLPDIEDEKLKESIETMLFWCRGYAQQST